MNITYLNNYNEPVKQAEKVLKAATGLSAQDEFDVLLLFLEEYAQMWYKVKNAAEELCLAQHADTANGYAEGLHRIRLRLSELFAQERTSNGK